MPKRSHQSQTTPTCSDSSQLEIKPSPDTEEHGSESEFKPDVSPSKSKKAKKSPKKTDGQAVNDFRVL